VFESQSRRSFAFKERRSQWVPALETIMQLSELIVSDPEIMSDAPCFRGTRVPVSVLFENLAAGMTLEEILNTWPSLERDDVLAVLELAGEEAEQHAAKAA
jgi:uncharacterized protein (DUF433 family)